MQNFAESWFGPGIFVRLPHAVIYHTTTSTPIPHNLATCSITACHQSRPSPLYSTCEQGVPYFLFLPKSFYVFLLCPTPLSQPTYQMSRGSYIYINNYTENIFLTDKESITTHSHAFHHRLKRSLSFWQGQTRLSSNSSF